MDDKCKFCDKPGLVWGCDEEGNAYLINPSGAPHACNRLRKVRRQNFSKKPDIHDIMRDYAEETRRRIPHHNAFDHNAD